MRNPFGSVFSDEIIKESRKKKSFSPSEGDKEPVQSRLYLLFLFLVIGLGFLLTRLFSLTVIEGGRYYKLSQENRTAQFKVNAPRGIIYDRNKIPLVRNIPAFILPDKRLYFESIPASYSAKMKETVVREYIFGKTFAHLLGYTGEITEEELISDEFKVVENEYRMGDIIGKIGLEKVYDKLLRGKDGREMFETDAIGDTVRLLGRIDPKNGENITLSVDAELQKAADSAMEGKKGAVIAQNPKSGEFLVFYSSPSFDPNRFVKNINVDEILSDKERPLFNRVISGTYAPGSTFKIITALAAIEGGVINKDTEFEDTGILTVGDFSFGNWYFLQYGKKEGMVDIVKAIRRSNDIFFYKTGEALGIERLAKFAKKIGLGEATGIKMPEEEKGLMPDPEWVKRVKNENWYLGNTYHVSIGQGDILVTPIQVNSWSNLVANGGVICTPHFLLGQKSNCKDLGLKRENLMLVSEGMRQACQPGGTGWPLFNFNVKKAKSDFKIDGINLIEENESTFSAKKVVKIPVACKTGTAEFGDKENKTHAWFTVFAPIENPTISVTVLVEGGGEGSSVAAPVAKKILEKYFGE